MLTGLKFEAIYIPVDKSAGEMLAYAKESGFPLADTAEPSQAVLRKLAALLDQSASAR